MRRHEYPKVNNSSDRPKVNTGDLVGHVLRKAVSHSKNPMMEAIFEEMSPEIDGILQKHLGGNEVDLETMQNGLARAGRVMQKIANARRQPA